MQLNFFSRDSSVISQMQKSFGVYIYGAGEYGYSVGMFLEKLDIHIAGYVIDDEFYKTDMKMSISEGKINRVYDVISLGEYLDHLSNGDEKFLVWGIARPSKLKMALEEKTIPEAWITYDACQMWSDYKFAHKHEKEFKATKSMLKDEKSKKTLDSYLAIFDGNPKDDIANLEDNTYFNELTVNEREGSFVDCGAYIGDTAIEYAKIYGTQRRIYSFEPDPVNYNRLIENTKDLNIVPVNAGVWSKKTVLHFDNCGDSSSCVQEEGTIEINVVSIDDVVGNDRVAFCKMDVEGSELQALTGMQNIIKRDMPILAISAYHKQEDLITLPQYIHQFETEDEYYALYLRHHGCTIPELVLYAIPTRK